MDKSHKARGHTSESKLCDRHTRSIQTISLNKIGDGTKNYNSTELTFEGLGSTF